MVQFPGDLYGLGVLDDILPLGNPLCNGLTFPGFHGMLGLEVGYNLLWMDPMLAMSTNNNLQTRDLFKNLMVHGVGLDLPDIYIYHMVVPHPSRWYKLGIWNKNTLKLDSPAFLSKITAPEFLLTTYCWC